MRLIIDIPDYNLNDIQNDSIACGQILKAVKNGTLVSTKLKQIREEIKSTYYSHGAGFDDFPHGFICAKDEDMKIIDKYIQKAERGNS